MRHLIPCIFVFHLISGSEVREFLDGNHALTASLYKQIASTDNFLVSPFSTEVVLALVQSGANGETGSEIRTRLQLPDSQIKTETAISRILPPIKRDPNYTLLSANKIYVKENFQLRDNFKRVASSVYDSEVESINFRRRKEAATTINRWVEQRTNYKIGDLIDEYVLSSRTRAILVNALYFQGQWAKPFKKGRTTKGDFHPSRTDRIRVDMMRIQKDYNYYESPQLGAKFLEMFFEGGDVSMVIVLPNELDGLSYLESRTEQVFAPHGFTMETVSVTLPKFRFRTSLDLTEILKNLGVRKIFDPEQADLSGIAGQKGDLVINKVIQKTFIDVKEEGVEAAAATFADVVVPLMGHFPSTPPKQFTADHPFIFYIKLKDLILFAGKVSIPRY